MSVPATITMQQLRSQVQHAMLNHHPNRFFKERARIQVIGLNLILITCPKEKMQSVEESVRTNLPYSVRLELQPMTLTQWLTTSGVVVDPTILPLPIAVSCDGQDCKGCECGEAADRASAITLWPRH